MLIWRFSRQSDGLFLFVKGLGMWGYTLNKINILLSGEHPQTVWVLLSDVLDEGLHYLLPAVGLHRMQVLHDLWGQSQPFVGQ